MTPSILLRPLSDVGYDLAEFYEWVAADAEWRESRPHLIGGPLRNRDGTIAPVPAYMRLDYFTDRDGPTSDHRPDLGPCWVWTGGTVRGYAYIRVGKRKVQAYRVNYERWIGPIPAGAVMDHLCRVRRCVRPTHVEPTTYRQNTIRSPLHTGMVKASRDRCSQGHPFDKKNTYVPPGSNLRQCRRCNATNKLIRTGGVPLLRRPTETHCGNGHSKAEHQRTTKSGKNYCFECNREAGQRFRDRQLGRVLT